MQEGSEKDPGSSEAIIDTLGNIGHYAASEGFDFEALCRTAQRHVTAERTDATSAELYG